MVTKTKSVGSKETAAPVRNHYSVIGHTRQRANLAKLVREDRLPTALLFNGIASIGKRGVAIELAQRLLCNSVKADDVTGTNATTREAGCGACKSCVLVKSGNHPDLHEVSFGGEDGASVDTLREVLDQLNLTAFLGGRKIAILNDTDNLSVVGANILLKSLEEPRPDTYFILIAANATRLPSTVLSRCQRWYFDRLSPADMKRIISANYQSEPDNLALLLAEGSFSSVETMQARPGMLEEIEDTLDAAFAGQASRIAMTVQKWASEKESIKDRITLLLAATQRRLTQSADIPFHSAIWAHAVQNVMDAEYLIIDRHVSPLTTLLTVLNRCSSAHGATLMEHPNEFTPFIGK